MSRRSKATGFKAAFAAADREARPAILEPVRRHYDRVATGYDRRWRNYLDVTLHTVADSVRFNDQERVLDIACGTGELERLLYARWPALRIVGTDISLGMLRQAIRKDEKLKVLWVQAEADRLPFPDQSFDWAICANSLHYFRSPKHALREANRVLRPGGFFVLLDWCDDYLSCKLCSMWLRLTDPAFCQTYTVRACRSMLEQSGFEVLEARDFRVRWIWGMMCFVCRRAPQMKPPSFTGLSTLRRGWPSL